MCVTLIYGNKAKQGVYPATNSFGCMGTMLKHPLPTCNIYTNYAALFAMRNSILNQSVQVQVYRYTLVYIRGRVLQDSVMLISGKTFAHSVYNSEYYYYAKNLWNHDQYMYLTVKVR